MTRKDNKTFANDRSAADFTIKSELEIWGTNSTLSEKKVTLEVASFDLHSDWSDKWQQEVVLAANSSTELYKGDVPGQPIRTKSSDVPKTIVISARILDGNSVLGRYSNWYAS
jgi:beta-mannosidase